MSKFVTTEKGTKLPLTNLKGKDYLMVAYRIQWFNEVVKSFRINTSFPVLTSEETVAQSTIEVLDESGKVIRTAMGTKRETKKDFSDHTEKAETGAIGRAITMLGYGTQFALADLDEGDRIIDSPVVDMKQSSSVKDNVVQMETKTETKKSTFRKPNVVTTTAVTPNSTTVVNTTTNDDGWQ